jgi:hypothetical protein
VIFVDGAAQKIEMKNEVAAISINKGMLVRFLPQNALRELGGDAQGGQERVELAQLSMAMKIRA